MCLLVVGALVLFWRLVELLYLIFSPSLVFIKSLHAIVISFTKTFDDWVNTAFGMGHIFLWRNNATNWNMSPIQEWRVHTLQQNITAIGLTYIYWVILLNINEHTVYVAAGFLPTIVYVVTFPSLFFFCCNFGFLISLTRRGAVYHWKTKGELKLQFNLIRKRSNAGWPG